MNFSKKVEEYFVECEAFIQGYLIEYCNAKTTPKRDRIEGRIRELFLDWQSGLNVDLKTAKESDDLLLVANVMKEIKRSEDIKQFVNHILITK